MNATERKRHEYARYEGQRAHIMGEPMTANPYSPTAPYGVHLSWQSGWATEHTLRAQECAGICPVCAKKIEVKP